jgi:hypothetical protein
MVIVVHLDTIHRTMSCSFRKIFIIDARLLIIDNIFKLVLIYSYQNQCLRWSLHIIKVLGRLTKQKCTSLDVG